jgi:predicted MFS family arabinose efflux permease
MNLVVNVRDGTQRGGPVPVILGGFVALAAAMGIGRFVYTPILPEMVAALGFSASEAGLIASANFLGYLLGALAAALPVFTAARRRWMLIGLLCSALSSGAMALTTMLPLFVVLRFVGGFASAYVLVFSAALVMERLAAIDKAHLSSYQFAGVGTGITLSAALVGQLAAYGLDWTWQWIASGLLSLAACVAVGLLIGPAPQRPPAQGAAGGGKSVRTPMIALVLSYGLFGFGYVITATFLVQLVRTSPTIAAIEPVIWVIVGLAAIPSVAIWSAVGRRLGAAAGYAVACLVEAAGVLASVLWVSPPGVVLAAILLGGTFVGITVLGFVVVRRLATGDLARTIALMTAAFGLGQIVGPILAGWLHDATGSFLLPSIAAAAALALGAALVARFTAPALR